MSIIPEKLITTHAKTCRNLMLQLLMGMLGTAIVLLVLHVMEPPQRVVTVDISGMIHRFVKTTSEEKLTQAQLQQSAMAFGKTLNTVLNRAARRQQWILLPREAVITGAKDVTRDVEQQIMAQLANAPATQHSK